MTSLFDWLFRDSTGRIVVGQFPNPALAVFGVAWGVERATLLAEPTATLVHGIAAGALIAWALDELARGVNPWRRLLGLGVLAYEATMLASTTGLWR